MPIRRTLALMIAAAVLLNCAALRPGFDPNIWLLDLRAVPGWIATPGLLTAAALLLGFAIRPRMSRTREFATFAAAAALLAVAAANAAVYYALLARGVVQSAMPVALSACLLAVLAAVVTGVRRARSAPSVRPAAGAAWSALTAAVILIGFPLAQMATFGQTDYRRPADAILVFGARAYADGTPSSALSDRVRTACSLYHAGLAPLIIMSGGPGDGPVHETESMQRLAESLGVPTSAIILDPAGLNTRGTIDSAAAMARDRRLGRILAISHFYHLPRIKLAADRAGLALYTIPAPQERPLQGLPWFMAREVAACWVYYIRAVAT